MKANISLKSGGSVLVVDIETIKMHKKLNSSEKVISVDNLDDFYIDKNRSYSFIGNSNVAINGEDILIVQFYQ